MMKLRQTASLSSAMAKLSPRAAVAWAQSSTTNRPCLLAVLAISGMLAGSPYKWTGTIARAFDVMASSLLVALMLRVLGSQSTSRGVAQASQIAPAVGTEVYGLAITPSP